MEKLIKMNVIGRIIKRKIKKYKIYTSLSIKLIKED